MIPGTRNPLHESMLNINRRQFFARGASGVGAAALGSLLCPEVLAAAESGRARAKRVIFLFQSGAPSQLDLFDYKPALDAVHGEELPDHVRRGQRITNLTAGQKSFPLNRSPFSFERVGQSGAWVSELLPHLKGVVDDLCFVKTMYTEAINHDPAITFFQSGAQQPGRPSMGSWLSYGLGSESSDLPSYVVMLSRGSGRQNAQPLYDRLFGAGFLPTSHQGVRFRSQGDPVLYLSNPAGSDGVRRRQLLDTLGQLNQLEYDRIQDPEVLTRIAQYELAYRMQTSVPELTDMSTEPRSVLDLYGPDVQKKGSYAYNCLLARRMAERGVRFVQLFHIGWDQHNDLESHLTNQCRDTDQASAALIVDLKQRGLLDDTLVIWGGEFGRTVYTQGKIGDPAAGRDHHPRCFTMWLAGGGVRPGLTYGKTDEYGYNIVDPSTDELMSPEKGHFTPGAVHVHDLHATMLHLLGVDHTRLTFKHQGRRHRLTDVHGHVVKDLLA